MNLEDAEAPENAAEGWKPDPMGASELRYWDGTAWTDRIGSRQPSDGAGQTNSGYTAPTKVCPHCGASAQTTSKKCPNCGKGYKKRTALKVFVAICVAGLIFVVGCTALLAGGVNEAVNELDAEQEKHAITRAQFQALEIGMTQQEVIDSTGKTPEDRQNFETEGILSKEPEKSSCIYYNRADGEFLDSYQLCFDNGELTSKNAW
ncbi:MAG: DUF2510 domain-containing protein [Solirubrobacterales bacterium]|nr:DUF2510 domain-containing protein [Solirubrobacterales bacterium]